MARTTLTPAEALAKIGLTVRTVTDRITRCHGKASEDDILAGKAWYGIANAVAVRMADGSDMTLDQAAAVIAQLSPRLRWSQNVESALMLAQTGELPRYVMSGPAGRARKASVAADPFATFGAKAKKTRSFARNITGDMHAVTVDVWAARVVGVTEEQLKLAGVYEAIAHCYRLAAKRAGIEPAVMQAITWIVVRGSAA